ncbi:MAG: MlaD family protein [Planctomycetota bacterium]|nr:MlaD family protein [Planctomycetota bacterium]
MAGLILLISILVWGIAFVARSQSHDWFHQRPTLTFTLDEAHGLDDGAVVRMSGVPVGTVQSVRLGQTNSVTVTLEILPEHSDRLSAGLVAEVIPPSFFGGTEVSLLPGAGAEPLGAGARIPARVKAGTTESFGTLAERMVGLSDHLEEIARGIREGEGSIGALIKDEGQLYANLNGIAEKASETVEQFRELAETATVNVDNMQGLIEKLESNAVRLNTLFEEVSVAMANVQTILTNLSEPEAGLPAVVKDLRQALDEATLALQLVSEEIPRTAEATRYTTAEARRLIRATERNILIRGNLDPLPEIETSISRSRRMDPYED